MLFGIVLLKFHLHDMCGLCDPKHCVVRFLACSPQLPVTNSLKLELYALRAIKGSLAPPYKPCLGSETYQTNCSREAWGGGGGFPGRGDLSALRPAIAASVSSHVMQSLLSVMSVLCAFSHVRHVSFAHFSLGRFGAMHVFSFISSFSVLIVLHGDFPMICFGRVFSFQLFCF